MRPTPLTTGMEGGRFLCQNVHPVVEAVALRAVPMLSRTHQHGAIDAALVVVDDMAQRARTTVHGHGQTLATPICLAVPHALVCTQREDALHRLAVQTLGPAVVAVVAWVWLRLRGPTSTHVVRGRCPTWHTVASALLARTV